MKASARHFYPSRTTIIKNGAAADPLFPGRLKARPHTREYFVISSLCDVGVHSCETDNDKYAPREQIFPFGFSKGSGE
jgi:hypothetical protein